jgi:GT2 family glycosyltransferase
VQSQRPDLSIVIVSYNTLELTRQCLASIYETARDISFDIWVVDNDSSDGSPGMVEAEFPQVNLVRNTENKGLAAATNNGLIPSSGRYAMALNSDTVALPGAMETLVRFMDDHPEVGGATPMLILPDEGRHPQFCGRRPSLAVELMDAASPLIPPLANVARKMRDGAEMDLETTHEVQCIIWGTAFIVRREVIDKIGGQDPAFFVYGEDVDWAMRILKAGWKLYYVSEARIVHYGGQSTKQASTKMLAQLQKSKARLIRKHCGLISGVLLRLTIAFVSGIRMLKWLPIYLLPAQRVEAAVRINQMWSIIRAVMVY